MDPILTDTVHFKNYTDHPEISLLNLINQAKNDAETALAVQRALEEGANVNEYGRSGFSEVHILKAAFNKCLYLTCGVLLDAGAQCVGVEQIRSTVNSHSTPPPSRRTVMPTTPIKKPLLRSFTSKSDLAFESDSESEIASSMNEPAHNLSGQISAHVSSPFHKYK